MQFSRAISSDLIGTDDLPAFLRNRGYKHQKLFEGRFATNKKISKETKIPKLSVGQQIQKSLFWIDKHRIHSAKNVCSRGLGYKGGGHTLVEFYTLFGEL